MNRVRGPVAAVVILAALLEACGGPAPLPTGSALSSVESSPASPRPTIVPKPGHEVYGFVPYWEMDDTSRPTSRLPTSRPSPCSR